MTENAFYPLPTMLLPSNYSRSCSRSPSCSPERRFCLFSHDLDPLLGNLSPESTIAAFSAINAVPKHEKEAHEILVRSISKVSTDERALGIRAAVAAQKLREWYKEVQGWVWPKGVDGHLGRGFLPPLGRATDQTRYSHDLDRITPETQYLGSLTVELVRKYEYRIDEIRDGMDGLDVEELKEHVLNAHIPSRSRPSSSHSTISIIPPPLSYVQLSDFTAVITATILRALPTLSRLNILLSTWDVRLLVLHQIPGLLATLETTRNTIDSSLSSLNCRDCLDENDPLFSLSSFHKRRDVLEQMVLSAGRRMDRVLDALEGRDDSLPESWIDDLEAIEADFGLWVVKAEKRAVENEWTRFKQEEKQTQGAATSAPQHDEKLDGISVNTSDSSEKGQHLKEPATECQASYDQGVVVSPDIQKTGVQQFLEDQDRPPREQFHREISSPQSVSERNAISTLMETPLAPAIENNLSIGVGLPDIEPSPENHVTPFSITSTEVRYQLLGGDVTLETLSVDSIIVGEEHDTAGPIVDVISEPDSEPEVFEPFPVTATMERGESTPIPDEPHPAILSPDALFSPISAPQFPHEFSEAKGTPFSGVNRDNDNRQSSVLESDARSVKDIPLFVPAEDFSLHPHQIDIDRDKSVESSTDFGPPGSSDFVPALSRYSPSSCDVFDSSHPGGASTVAALRNNNIDEENGDTLLPKTPEQKAWQILDPCASKSQSHSYSPSRDLHTADPSKPEIPKAHVAMPAECHSVEVPTPGHTIYSSPGLTSTDSERTLRNDLSPSSKNKTLHRRSLKRTKEASLPLQRFISEGMSSNYNAKGGFQREGSRIPRRIPALRQSASPPPNVRPRPAVRPAPSNLTRKALAASGFDDELLFWEPDPQSYQPGSHVHDVEIEHDRKGSEHPLFTDPDLQAVSDSGAVSGILMRPSNRLHSQSSVETLSSLYEDDEVLESLEASTRDESDAAPRPFREPFRETDDRLQDKIHSILSTIPARIRLESTAVHDLEPRSGGSSLSASRSDKLGSKSPYLTPSRSSTPTPSITLTPAFPRLRHSRLSGGEEKTVRVYHLRRTGKTAPTKLFVRSVGENGERVMVRVGGGWADLGEYLREYALHHGRRTASNGCVEVQGLPTQSSPTCSSPVSNLTPTSENGCSTSLSRPNSVLSTRPSSSLAVRKTRRPSGPASGLPNVVAANVQQATEPLSPVSRTSSRRRLSVSSTNSTVLSTFGEVENISTPHPPSTRAVTPGVHSTPLGLAGPKPRSRHVSMSPESEAWVEDVIGQARKTSASHNPSKHGESRIERERSGEGSLKGPKFRSASDIGTPNLNKRVLLRSLGTKRDQE